MKSFKDITERLADRQVIRQRSAGSGIAKATNFSLRLPATSTMKKKMDAVMKKDAPTRRKMSNLVTSRETDKDGSLILYFKSARARKNFQSMMNEVSEEMPANNASGGAVAGLGDQPPVSKKAQKKKQKQGRISTRMMPAGMSESVENPEYDPELGEMNIGEAKATARNIVKGLSDADGPFTVVAIKRNKVIKQETTKRRDMLPAIIKTMRKEVGSGVTIGIEDKKGTIRNTFKEDVELDEATNTRVVVDLNDAGNRARAVYRKMESEIAGLDGYRESEFDRAKNRATFHFDAKKHDKSERKKVAGVIKKTKGADFHHSMTEAYTPDQRQAIAKVKEILFRKNKIGFYTATGKIMVSPKDEKKAKELLDKAFGGNFTKKTGLSVKKGIGPKRDFKINAGSVYEETFAGCRVFKVSQEDYANCVHPRQKNERWDRKLNMEVCGDIRKYAHRNPGKAVIVQDEKSGAMSYLILSER